MIERTGERKLEWHEGGREKDASRVIKLIYLIYYLRRNIKVHKTGQERRTTGNCAKKTRI